MGAGDGVKVVVDVEVGMAVAVGDAIICVTKLHDNNNKTKSPKKILFIFIDSNPIHVPIILIPVEVHELAHIGSSCGFYRIETHAHLPEADGHAA